MDVKKTIADAYIQEGEAKGKAEGLTEGEAKGIVKTAINLLKEKADVNFVSKVTGLSIDEIVKIKNTL